MKYFSGLKEFKCQLLKVATQLLAIQCYFGEELNISMLLNTQASQLKELQIKKTVCDYAERNMAPDHRSSNRHGNQN